VGWLGVVEERILTKHPKGKKGVRIRKAKYDVIRSAIIDCLKEEELTHMGLTNCVNQKLRENFQDSINWYVETVKLDLEARNVIERTTNTKPQLYFLNKDL
jgi:hypothetical protein